MGTTHEKVNIVLGDVQVGNPTEALDFTGLGIFFPVLDKGYPAILIRLVERSIMHDAKVMDDVFFLPISHGQL